MVAETSIRNKKNTNSSGTVYILHQLQYGGLAGFVPTENKIFKNLILVAYRYSILDGRHNCEMLQQQFLAAGQSRVSYTHMYQNITVKDLGIK